MTAESSKKDVTTMTKRARRKLGANPSQVWPQMPKIQSASARANAYLRVAGLNTKIKAPPLDPEIDLMNSPEVKFGRLLASTEQRVRHEAVRRLNKYLKDRCVIGDKEGMGISELDLLKLWKALWYTLYMADRVPVQDELSKHLAELIWCVAGTEEEDEYAGKTYLDMYGDEEGDDYDDEEDVVMEEISNTLDKHDDDEEDNDSSEAEESEESEDGEEEERDEEEEDEDEESDTFIPHCRGAHLAALFVKTFFQTVRREWGRMDKYRVDKFYTLIRLMMEQVYSYMAKRHWNLGIVRLFNDTIYEEILCRTPNGLRLHLVDLSLHELAKVNANAPMPLTEATFLDCLGPYFAMTQLCDDRVVQGRVVENVLLKFLNEYSVICPAALEETEDDEEESLILEQVHVGTVANFIFELASESSTKDDYRESLYETFKLFKRRLKEVGKDVILDQHGEEEDEDLEQVENDDENVRFIEVDDPVTLDQNSDAGEEVASKSSSKGRKKRKHVPEEESEEEEEVQKSKKKKKKKKKEKRDATPEANEDEDEQVESKSSKKSRKKGKKAKEATDEEEVISISVADQKRAKKVVEEEDAAEEEEEQPVKKKSKKKKKSRESEEEDRRVSFGKLNHSKSYKASMRSLKTMESPKAELITPDKSILRVKSPSKSSGSKGSGKKGKRKEKGRKKAVDYF